MNYELSTAGSPVAGILNGKFGFGKLIRHCRPLLSAVLEYGIGRFCRSQGTPRGRETDSPADEYDPTESVALRDYSVLFIFNKLGSRVAVPPPRGGGHFSTSSAWRRLLRTCLHRLATSGDTAEYVGLNTFLDCLRGPGPSSPLVWPPSPRFDAVRLEPAAGVGCNQLD